MSFEIFLSRMVLAAGELAVRSGHPELQSAVTGLKVELLSRDLLMMSAATFGLYCYQRMLAVNRVGSN